MRGRPAGQPPTGGAYGRRGVRGPQRSGPIPDAPAERGGEGRQPGEAKAAGPAALSAQVAALPAVVTEAAAARRPSLGPLLRVRGLGRRLRSATARRAALRAEPGRPSSAWAAASPRSPSPGPARPQPRPCSFEPAWRPAWIPPRAPSRQPSRRRSIRQRPLHCSEPHYRPTLSKTDVFLKITTPKERKKMRKQGFYRPFEIP